jgi:hypothetical protein
MTLSLDLDTTGLVDVRSNVLGLTCRSRMPGARAVGKRMRDEAESLDDPLARAWADGCDALRPRQRPHALEDMTADSN